MHPPSCTHQNEKMWWWSRGAANSMMEWRGAWRWFPRWNRRPEVRECLTAEGDPVQGGFNGERQWSQWNFSRCSSW